MLSKMGMTLVAYWTYTYRADVLVKRACTCVLCLFVLCSYCGRWSHEGESWYHIRSVTPISVLKAGHVEHLPQYIYFLSFVDFNLSLSFLTE